MANMSYCRFENTLSDLQACYDSMLDREELSKSEKRARDEMAELCQNFVDEYDRMTEEESEEEED